MMRQQPTRRSVIQQAHKAYLVLAPDARAKTFIEGLDAGEVTRHPVTLDLDRLEYEKQSQLAFLRSVPF